MQQSTSARSPNHGEHGMALLTSVVVLVMVTAAAAVIMSAWAQQTRFVNRQSNMMRARSIAESGLSEAYARLKQDFTLREDGTVFPRTELAGGEYDVTVTGVGESRAQISSVGRFDGAETEVVLDVYDAPLVEGGALTAFDYTFYAGQDFLVNSNSRFTSPTGLVGSIYAGRNCTCSASAFWDTTSVDVRSLFTSLGATRIRGAVTVPKVNLGAVSTDKAFPDEYRAEVPAEVGFPVIDLVGYYRIAEAHGQVFQQSGTVKISEELIIPGGIRWYETGGEPIVFSTGLTWTGCIVATGPIMFSGSAAQTTASNWTNGELPAVISRDGAISFSSSATWNGLAYAPGDIVFQGSCEFTGTCMAGGSIYMFGSPGGITYNESTPEEPDDTTDPTTILRVTAWQK